MNENRIPELDKYYPSCGPCAFCGFHDKRHRLWDVFIFSPDSDEDVAHNYNCEVEHVRLVREIRPYVTEKEFNKQKNKTRGYR